MAGARIYTLLAVRFTVPNNLRENGAMPTYPACSVTLRIPQLTL